MRKESFNTGIFLWIWYIFYEFYILCIGLSFKQKYPRGSHPGYQASLSRRDILNYFSIILLSVPALPLSHQTLLISRPVLRRSQRTLSLLSPHLRLSLFPED